MSNTKCILSLVLLLHGLQFAVTAAPAEQSPNILLIITDQQFAEAMSCAGNPHVQTPAIDGLAERGTVFTQSYCTSPVCAPSRGSMLTGLFPHQHGVTENGRRIRSDLKETCIEHLLAAKGYDCVYAGKWHLAASRTIGRIGLKQHPYRVIADSNDARVSDACAQYVGEEHHRPFFLVASYTNPHDICLWAAGKRDGHQRYPVPEIPPGQCPPLPVNYAISEDEPSVLREYYMTRHFEYETFNDEKWRRYLHAYYWMVETVDAEIGRLLDALRANGLEKNTLVVFTSDHGDGLAAHQWLGKCTHYEEATRVPFIVSFPGVIEPGRVDQTHLISSGPDLYATALDFAGVAIPAGCQGRSLRCLLERTPASDAWRDQVVSEIWVPGSADPTPGNPWKSAWGRMLRTARFKYAVYDRGEHREQLYDLRNDRHEKHNLAADPIYHDVLTEHRRRLAAWCKETGDTKFTASFVSDGTPGITRTIDASQYFRPFPDLVAHRNTSIQKAPAPVLLEVSEREFGKAEITKCWLNLDEMWDYRTRQYDYNYRIGVHKYDDVPEKHAETWGSVSETRVHFHDYLKSCGKHSDAVMLTIRRYERDVLDRKLGVTMEDWKTIFKKAVMHYKEVCPNLRYIEACNEYALKGFIGCTVDEYYEFYRLAYQAVNEANAELKLTGDKMILIGGPVVTGGIVTKLNLFFENFAKDPSPHKRLDFVSWHEYHNNYAATAHREGQVRHMLSLRGLPKELPLFITEHDPYHPKAGAREYNLINAAGLVKSLYFTDRFSPGIKIMPWVQYHVAEIQTRFMWFDGPNEPDTKAEELRMLPAGCSMKLLSMHKDWEIAVDNAIANDEIVLASVQNHGLVVHVVNYGEPQNVRLRIDNLPKVFSALAGGKVRLVKYLIDQEHSNCVADPDYPGGIEKVEDGWVEPVGGSITLMHPGLSKNGILLWELVPATPGAVLNSPVASPFSDVELQPLPFDAEEAVNRVERTASARIERDGSVVRVHVQRCNDRAGVTFRPNDGAWDMTGLDYLEARVKNVGSRTLKVHLALDNPGADRAGRTRCCIESATIPAGEEQKLNVRLSKLPPWAFNPGKVVSISVYVYHPGSDYDYEVLSLRVGQDARR